MWELVKGLTTSFLADKWPLVAGAILCVAIGWLLRGGVDWLLLGGVEKMIGMIRKSKKNNDAISRTKGYRTENGNEDSENKSAADPNKENGLEEILEWTARNIERNKGNVFDLKEIWVGAIEPAVNIGMKLRTKIQKSGISCSIFIEAEGVSKKGKQWLLYISEDDIRDKEEFNRELERKEISNEIIQVSIKITLILTFANTENKEMLGIKGIFYKPGERIIGEWKDNRYNMYRHGEAEQSSRRGYDRDGIYEMLEEQVKKTIERWRKEIC